MPSATINSGFVRKPLIEKLKLLALFVLIGALIFFSKPILPLFSAGAVLTAIGALIRVWAAGHLTRDQRLTVSGPYEYTRNPFYLGRFCVLIGFALMSGLQNPFVWAIFAVGLIFFFFFYMPRKEQREGGRLAELFGPDFETYRDNVPSLFPRFTPFKMHPRPWSRELFFGGDDQYSGNKELWTTIATFVLIGLFLLRLLNPQG